MPGRGPSGWLCLFNGRFHNQADVVSQLDLPKDCSPADCYAAAIGRWGDLADDHVIGHYCAICCKPGSATLRLSRSPFLAPPLHFRAAGEWAVASSVPRSLFWRDNSIREVDYRRLARALALDDSQPLQGWFKGCGRVPLGTVVELDVKGARIVWQYDLFSRPDVRYNEDEDYVEAARALLDEAVGKELAGSRRPGSFVSGGLDSAQVVASALRQLPEGRVLHGFTYDPEPDWHGSETATHYIGERAAVERFAAVHPNFAPHFFTNSRQDFRYGQRDLLRAMDCSPSSAALCWRFQDIFEAARGLGCDIMLSGDFGNETFSQAGEWAYCEYFMKGRWVQLTRALKTRYNSDRSLPLKFLGACVFPLLPRPLRGIVSRIRKQVIPDPAARIGLSARWADRNGVTLRERPPLISRRAYWQLILSDDGQDMAEMHQGLEQLYGISYRDPTCYRPLVEFCYGIPTDQFMRDGVDRWLARRMAAGRLPDEQRWNRRQGMHNADWHLRTSRARMELIEGLDRMSDDEDIAQFIDIAALRQALEDFPADEPDDRLAALPYVVTVPLAMTAGRFIAYVKGRNDI